MGYPGFTTLPLHGQDALFVGVLPDALRLDAPGFERLWASHPATFHDLVLHGRRVLAPRWSQAYGVDYHYSGGVNAALPVPPDLCPLLAWTREVIDARLNGLLLNWYDARLGHYIGPHRDSIRHMAPDAPIVTVSCGAERVFRVRRWKGDETIDVPVRDGTVLVMPYAVNARWTHSVPALRRHEGRRISITVRAFDN